MDSNSKFIHCVRLLLCHPTENTVVYVELLTHIHCIEQVVRFLHAVQLVDVTLLVDSMGNAIVAKFQQTQSATVYIER